MPDVRSALTSQLWNVPMTLNEALTDRRRSSCNGRKKLKWHYGVVHCYYALRQTTPIRAMIPKAKQLLIWDAKNEYGLPFKMKVIRTIPQLLAELRKATNNGRFAYVPTGYDKKEFDQFCRLAHIWNRQKEAVIVIEELAAVTNCGKASGYWGVLVNQSLGLGATIFATVQRGQEVDKSVMNAASYLWICQHNTESDVEYMAKKIGVNPKKIPRAPLKFIVWNPTESIVGLGKIVFNKTGPKFILNNKGLKPLPTNRFFN